MPQRPQGGLKRGKENTVTQKPAHAIIVSGFLGAGKTTLIRHLLQSHPPGAGRVAIIVNELGAVGVDGALLQGVAVDILELTSGCICCSMKGDFLRAVAEVCGRFQPDTLLVEATGVAQPADILEILAHPSLRRTVAVGRMVTVVDADFFPAREVLGDFYDNQIRWADLILLNKCDLVSESDLADMAAILKRLNSGARLLTVTYGQVDPEVVFRVQSQAPPVRAGGGGVGGGDFESVNFEAPGIMDREALSRWLEGLPPGVFRVKGWARLAEGTAYVELSGTRRRIEPGPRDAPTRLVIIGRGLDGAHLLETLRACVRQGSRNA